MNTRKRLVVRSCALLIAIVSGHSCRQRADIKKLNAQIETLSLELKKVRASEGVRHNEEWSRSEIGRASTVEAGRGPKTPYVSAEALISTSAGSVRSDEPSSPRLQSVGEERVQKEKEYAFVKNTFDETSQTAESNEQIAAPRDIRKNLNLSLLIGTGVQGADDKKKEQVFGAAFCYFVNSDICIGGLALSNRTTTIQLGMSF